MENTKTNIDYKLCIYRTSCKLEVYPTMTLNGFNICIYPANRDKNAKFTTYDYKNGEKIKLSHEEFEKLHMFFLCKGYLSSEVIRPDIVRMGVEKTLSTELEETVTFFHKFQKGNISTTKSLIIGLKINDKTKQLQYVFTLKNVETGKQQYIYLAPHECSMIDRYCSTFISQYQLLQYIHYSETFKDRVKKTIDDQIDEQENEQENINANTDDESIGW